MLNITHNISYEHHDCEDEEVGNDEIPREAGVLKAADLLMRFFRINIDREKGKSPMSSLHVLFLIQFKLVSKADKNNSYFTLQALCCLQEHTIYVCSFTRLH